MEGGAIPPPFENGGLLAPTIMNSDGTSDTVMFAGPAAMVAWSPDCRKILYVDAFGGNVWARRYP